MKNRIRLCSFMIVFSMIFSPLVQATTTENDTLSVPLSIYCNSMTTAEAVRFGDIVSAEAQSISNAFDENITPVRSKELLDFAGNRYTLIECEPSGYMIYHDASGQFVETSSSSPSPYNLYSENLYYGGPTQYYVLENGIYQHTILDEECSESTVETFASTCTQANDNLISSSNNDVLNYITGNASAEPSAIDQIYSSTSETSPTYITNAYCLSNCETASEMSYFPKGACGYIAAALLMLWYRSTINPTYLTYNNSSGVPYLTSKNGYYVFCGNPSNYANGQTFSYNLWRWHSGYGQSDYENGYYGTGAGEIANTLESYVEGKGLTYTYDTDVLPTTASIINKLDSRDRPYLLWGSLGTADGATGSIDHAVIVYGHFNGLLLCNFGWAGYSCVSISGIWGSGLMLYQ